MKNKQPFTIKRVIGARTEGEFSVLVPQDATLEQVIISFSKSQNHSVTITPIVRQHTPAPYVKNIIQGDGTLSGDGESYNLVCNIPIRAEERIGVKYVSNSDFDYDFVAAFMLDFEGGMERALL